MALSGSFQSAATYAAGSGYGKYVYVTWSATQSVANNTSTVSWTAYYKNPDGDRSGRYAQCYNNSYITMGGATRLAPANGTKCYDGGTAGSGSFVVYHNADGTGSFSWGIYFNFYTGGGYNSTGSGTAYLDTIARASQPSVSSGSVAIGSAVTINTNRASSGFTHNLYIYVSGVNRKTISGVGASTSFTPDYATFAPLNTAGTTMSATIYCDTYSGSTYIGQKSCALTISIPNNSTTQPTCSIGTPAKADSVVPASWGIWVRGQSKVIISPSYSYKYSTSAQSYSISGGGYSSTSSTLTTGTLNTAGTNTFSASVTDKRGFTSTASTVSITVVDWQAPTISAILSQRCNSNGTLNDEGTYCKITGTTGYSLCLNGSTAKNSATTKIYYREFGQTSWTQGASFATANGSFSRIIGTGTTFNVDKSYDILIEVTDTFKTSTYQDILTTANYTMVLRHGGNGVSFGKASEMEALESAFPAYFYNGIKGKQNPTDTEWVDVLDKLSILYNIAEHINDCFSLGCNDMNTETRWITYWGETCLNRPQTDYGVLFTFGNSITASSGNNWRFQLAFGTNNYVWHRQSINRGSWTAWAQL